MINTSSILLVLLGTFIGAIAALLLKKGTDKYPFRRLVRSKFLWVGLLLYGISSIFYLVALKQESVSVIYPFVSTSYVWTTFFSVKYLKEKMNGYKWAALLGIIMGIVLIGIGG